ncbi:MAG: AGE family epimerase/isomerase [Rhodobacteraceae bacterium]|nr:AGE family epimerase/isomerase [Paracoccaceae bacterium]
MTSPQTLAQIETWLRDWLADAVALWLDRGLDRPRGGFHEHLSPDTLTCAADFRRLRVVTRQIYAFSAAHRLGHPEAREAVDFGLAFLLGRARHPQGGYANRFDLDGGVIDETRDLYDLAFVLFALAHAWRLTGDSALRDEAEALAGFITREMTHPAGGLLESLPPKLPRRQNPHMHLLEATLAWSDADRTGVFAALRDRLVALLAAHFVDAGGDYLREYLDEDLNPLPAPRGTLWEPGHHWEWVWLLAEAARAGAAVPSGLGDRLAAKARRQGVSPATGLCWGEVADDGTILQPVTRIWSQGEWLKAEAVTPGPDRDARAARAFAALRHFLGTSPRGLWFERADAATGALVSEPSPATSFYHIVMAIEVVAAARTA